MAKQEHIAMIVHFLWREFGMDLLPQGEVMFVLVLHAMLEQAIEDGVQESCARMYQRAQFVSVN